MLYFVQLAVQACLHQHHHKQVSNVLHYDVVMMTVMSLDDRKFYGTVVMREAHR